MRSASLLAAVKSGLQAAAVALPYRSNVITHAQRTEAIRQLDALEQFRQHECRLRRDCGVESNTCASLISIYEIGDCYESISCSTRATTNDSKKGWNRSRQFELVCLSLKFSRRASPNTLHRARIANLAQHRTAKSIATTARPSIRQKRPRKSSGHHKGRRLLDQQQRRAQGKQRCSTPYHRSRRD